MRWSIAEPGGFRIRRPLANPRRGANRKQTGVSAHLGDDTSPVMQICIPHFLPTPLTPLFLAEAENGTSGTLVEFATAFLRDHAQSPANLTRCLAHLPLEVANFQQKSLPHL